MVALSSLTPPSCCHLESMAAQSVRSVLTVAFFSRMMTLMPFSSSEAATYAPPVPAPITMTSLSTVWAILSTLGSLPNQSTAPTGAAEAPATAVFSTTLGLHPATAAAPATIAAPLMNSRRLHSNLSFAIFLLLYRAHEMRYWISVQRIVNLRAQITAHVKRAKTGDRSCPFQQAL